MMTADEFYAQPADGTGRIWELVDGVPRAQDPASDTLGTITTNLAALIYNHLRATRPNCRLVTNPGIRPQVLANWNHRVPELGVTCTPARSSVHPTPDVFLIVEVLSKSNASQTWGNISLFGSIASVTEILVVDSRRIEAYVMRRLTNGSWPSAPERIEADITLAAIELSFPLDEAYRNTDLVSPA
jgi:Uma2 family endonuclease